MNNEMEKNFSYSAWQNKSELRYMDVPPLNLNLPDAPDNYTPGHLSWGKDPKRGRAIQIAREKKRMENNAVFFFEKVLPLIEGRLNAGAWLDLAIHHPERKDELMKRGGFIKYSLGERYSWIHPRFEKDKIEQAKNMGATPQI